MTILFVWPHRSRVFAGSRLRSTRRKTVRVEKSQSELAGIESEAKIK